MSATDDGVDLSTIRAAPGDEQDEVGGKWRRVVRAGDEGETDTVEITGRDLRLSDLVRLVESDVCGVRGAPVWRSACMCVLREREAETEREGGRERQRERGRERERVWCVCLRVWMWVCRVCVGEWVCAHAYVRHVCQLLCVSVSAFV
jgi:hypothetical protein